MNNTVDVLRNAASNHEKRTEEYSAFLEKLTALTAPDGDLAKLGVSMPAGRRAMMGEIGFLGRQYRIDFDSMPLSERAQILFQQIAHDSNGLINVAPVPVASIFFDNAGHYFDGAGPGASRLPVHREHKVGGTLSLTSVYETMTVCLVAALAGSVPAALQYMNITASSPSEVDDRCEKAAA